MKRFKLEINDDHLLFFGDCEIKVVPQIKVGNYTISSRLKIREYYENNDGKIPFELIASQYFLNLPTEFGEHLYKLDESMTEIPENLLNTLKFITGDDWVSEEKESDFNLYGTKVVYNGYRSDAYNRTDKAYRYVIALELSDYCANLKGVIQIGYNNDRKTYPGYVGGRVIRPTPIFKL